MEKTMKKNLCEKSNKSSCILENQNNKAILADEDIKNNLINNIHVNMSNNENNCVATFTTD